MVYREIEAALGVALEEAMALEVALEVALVVALALEVLEVVVGVLVLAMVAPVLDLNGINCIVSCCKCRCHTCRYMVG